MRKDSHMPHFANQANCANSEYDTNWWFPQEAHGTRRWTRTVEANKARAICSTCPARNECFEYSIKYSRLYGIWAGLDWYERDDIQKREGVIPMPWIFTYFSSEKRSDSHE
jgi:hypothetical protein